MKFFNCVFLLLSASVFIVGCGKDKNMDDFRNEQLTQSMSRINAFSGSYYGAVTSKIGNSNLGNIILTFTANTSIQSSTTGVTSDLSAIVSGSIRLSSLPGVVVPFNNGYFNDRTGDFQVDIPVIRDDGTKDVITLKGQISEGVWNGKIYVNDQEDYASVVTLRKNSPPANTSSQEEGGVRLEQIKSLDYRYGGIYQYDGKSFDFTLSFTKGKKDNLPEHKLFKIFSPERLVSVKCDLKIFQLEFTDAILNDELGTLAGPDTTKNSNLSCTRFIDETNKAGWNCEIAAQINIQAHLTIKQ